MDFLDYMDEIYEEIVSEFGHEVESECIHKWYKSQSAYGVSSWLFKGYLIGYSYQNLIKDKLANEPKQINVV